jgi:hypothetical protein
LHNHIILALSVPLFLYKGKPEGALVPSETIIPPPSKLKDNIRRVKRGEASLIYPFPLPLIKGKGDKGGWGFSTKGGEVNK